MPDYLKANNSQILVDCYAMEVYLPEEYSKTGYRGTPFYSVMGSKVDFLAIGNMRFFTSEKELQDPESVKCHPLGVPMFITSQPGDIDVRDVRFSKNGRLRRCLVLTYHRGDALVTNREVIRNSDAMMMTLSRLEQGKLDNVSPEVAVSIVRDCQTLNKVNLRIPSEELEIFVAERYRDPDHPGRKYRFHTGAVDPDSTISRNMRTDAMQSTTYQALMHEDINTSVLASVNRRRAGIVDDVSPMEAVVRGLDMEELKREDHGDEG